MSTAVFSTYFFPSGTPWLVYLSTALLREQQQVCKEEDNHITRCLGIQYLERTMIDQLSVLRGQHSAAGLARQLGTKCLEAGQEPNNAVSFSQCGLLQECMQWGPVGPVWASTESPVVPVALQSACFLQY